MHALFLKEGKYNLSAFNLEQSCQLFLKFLIGKKLVNGKKHFLNELVRELSKAYKGKEIINYYKKTSYSLRT